MKDRKTVFDCMNELDGTPFQRDVKYELTKDEKASLRIIRLESEIIYTKEKLIELNRELDTLIEEMIF